MKAEGEWATWARVASAGRPEPVLPMVAGRQGWRFQHAAQHVREADVGDRAAAPRGAHVDVEVQPLVAAELERHRPVRRARQEARLDAAAHVDLVVVDTPQSQRLGASLTDKLPTQEGSQAAPRLLWREESRLEPRAPG